MKTQFEINDLIGEYRVTGFLGEGGMGIVYSGMHEKLGRPAAIKILRTTGQDETFKTRFFNEARLQAGLHHPNIATLYDFREEGDNLVIIMELVDGECLDELITRRTFTIDEVLTVFSSICEAISYIHKNGVIHRDIKAQNAKLTSGGSLKLLDFGIAKDSSSQGLTQTGGVIGTPNYLSPEQLENKPASVQTDIWALGILLYEMLTGGLPFQSDTLGGLVLKITKAEFPPAHTINPAVTREVEALVAKCLKRDTASRYRSVDELLLAVQNILNVRHGNATLHDLKTAMTNPGQVAGLPGTMVVDEAPATLYASGNSTAPSKPFPIALVAGIGGAALLILFILVGGFLLLSGSDKPANQSPGGVNSVVAGTKGNTKIRVDVDEGKAQVLKNGQSLGTTPLDMEADLGDNVPLTLRRDGFEDKNVSIQVTSGKKVFTFSLKAK